MPWPPFQGCTFVSKNLCLRKSLMTKENVANRGQWAWTVSDHHIECNVRRNLVAAALVRGLCCLMPPLLQQYDHYIGGTSHLKLRGFKMFDKLGHPRCRTVKARAPCTPHGRGKARVCDNTRRKQTGPSKAHDWSDTPPDTEQGDIKKGSLEPPISFPFSGPVQPHISRRFQKELFVFFMPYLPCVKKWHMAGHAFAACTMQCQFNMSHVCSDKQTSLHPLRCNILPNKLTPSTGL